MELYIKAIGDPNFRADQMQVDEDIQLILTQIETLLFTAKGSVMGSPDFGLNLEDYVYSFMYNNDMIKGVVSNAISEYIPLSTKYNVNVEVDYVTETERNAMYIDITIDNRFGIGLYV
jgi:phage baseplate assembly protein W